MEVMREWNYVATEVSQDMRHEVFKTLERYAIGVRNEGVSGDGKFRNQLATFLFPQMNGEAHLTYFIDRESLNLHIRAPRESENEVRKLRSELSEFGFVSPIGSTAPF